MQEWLTKHYDLILSVCRDVSVNYEDLAHDVILTLKPKAQRVPENELRYYIFKRAKNRYLNILKRERYTELTHDPRQQEDEPTKDPYEYIQRLKDFKAKEEILGIALELYYLHEGNVTEITRDMKKRTGETICRQTLTKYIEEAKQKL